MRLAVVTATLDLARARPCLDSWWKCATGTMDAYVILQAGESQPPGWGEPLPGYPDRFQVYWTPDILGVVPAFALGVQKALEDGAEIIACLHDDLEIEEPGWDATVLAAFARYPEMGLAGFGGALGLGDSNIYQVPYHPMQLARQTFLSNMRHAEAHGGRMRAFQWVSCLDGFSQIGRRKFWQGWANPRVEWSRICTGCGAHNFGASALPGRCGFCDGQENSDTSDSVGNLFMLMQSWGITHHAYDGALGCFAKRLGWWPVGLIPIRCHHSGGRTAVADPRYTDWAREKFTSITHEGQQVQGDAACWTHAHREVYERFRDVLPLRVP